MTQDFWTRTLYLLEIQKPVDTAWWIIIDYIQFVLSNKWLHEWITSQLKTKRCNECLEPLVTAFVRHLCDTLYKVLINEWQVLKWFKKISSLIILNKYYLINFSNGKKSWLAFWKFMQIVISFDSKWWKIHQINPGSNRTVIMLSALCGISFVFGRFWIFLN